MTPVLADNFLFAQTALAVVTIAELALAFALPGVAAGFGQRWSVANSARWAWVGPVLTVAAAVGGAFGASALPADTRQFICQQLGAESGWMPAAVVLTGLLLGAAAAMLVSVAWWDRRYIAGQAAGLRAAGLMVPIALGCALVAWITLAAWPEPETQLVAPRSATVPLAAMLLLVGLNAGGLARAMANRGLDRWASLAVCVVPTLVIGAAQNVLLTVIFDRWGVEWSAGQVLIGADAQVSDPIQLLGRVVLAHAAVVAALAFGGWIGIRVAPRPIVRHPRHTPRPIPGDLPPERRGDLADASGREPAPAAQTLPPFDPAI